MQKSWSLFLGKVQGIKVFIHWTFWILIIWIFIMHFQMGHGFYQALIGVLFIFAIFTCVVLHELGHSLTARKFKIQTKDITIYPIGGVASLESMPDKPIQELLVALAGPFVNILIAFVLWVYLRSSGQNLDFSILSSMDHMSGMNFGFNLFAVNVILALFNLIPAFPMDGGRVLRSVLAFKLDRARATQIASFVGQVLAIGFVFLGFFFNFWLVFIGLFIFLGAGAESKFETLKSALGNVKVHDVMMTNFTVFNPDDLLQKAIMAMTNTNETCFLIAKEKKVVGSVGQQQIIHGLHEFGNSIEMGKIMQEPPEALKADDQLSREFTRIQQHPQRVFPVLSNGDLVGIISMEKIQQWLNIRGSVTK